MIEELKEHVYGYNELGDPEFVGPPTREELKDKINEIVRYLNSLISVGILPINED